MNAVTERFFQSPTGVFDHPEVAIGLRGTPFRKQALLKRALAKGEILQVRRGLYCLAPRYQRHPIAVYALAQRVHGPSYVSLESALSYHGWIPEAVYACTNVSLGPAKTFETPLGIFSYQRVPQRVFYTGVARCVDADGTPYFMASPAKALADYVYLHRESWEHIEAAAASLRIEQDDWAGVDAGELEVLLTNYTNRRVRRFLAAWQAALQP